MKFMVAFISPKRSAGTLEAAARHAKALNAELVILKVIPDPHKVGVIAELIATDRPIEKARQQVEAAAAELTNKGINATGVVRVDEVARGIVKAAIEHGIDLLFVGTVRGASQPGLVSGRDPIVHYVVDHCPTALCLVRQELPPEDAVHESPTP